MLTARRRATLGCTAIFFAAAVAFDSASQQSRPAPADSDGPRRELVSRYCVSCHNERLKRGDLALDTVAGQDIAAHPEIWEKVVRKIRARQMPPVGLPRPDAATYDAVVDSLETALDRAAAARPNPGRTATFRRLTRSEYQNAIRDLLALDIDAASLLPGDESSYGFDNVTVGDLSPTLLDRYISAAETISRNAVGRPGRSPDSQTIRVPPDVTQEEHLEGLPIGTRGGALVHYTFPIEGEYEIQIRLTRDRDEYVEGLTEPHDLEVSLDRDRLQVFTVRPPLGSAGSSADSEPSHDTVDQHLKLRVTVKAGAHAVGVAFLKKPSLLIETAREPYLARFNSYRHPRLQPAIYSIAIIGPYSPGAAGDSPSRRRIFGSPASIAGDEERSARRILGSLMRRAYRRPVTDADLEGPLALYRKARADEGVDAGIEMALSAILVSPEFLFRVETDPAGLPPGAVYRIGDVELASRLSFFLWSSIPDEELLDLAAHGKLHEPATLERQVRRMLADTRSSALVTNFAGQWLHLRKLDAITPDMRLFPDFDDNLRQSMRRETELFVESVLREDRSALDLIEANYTFLDERLARHYRIPHVYGSRFRRVTLDEGAARGGLLRQASILAVTSYATRTSPVVRGKWVLDNLLGVPPPPPLPDVPALKDNTVDGNLSVRRRLTEHRTNAACASCHNLMDPIGLSLERFDAVGRRRDDEAGMRIDSSGALPDGSEFADVQGLERALLARPEIFVSTISEKLLTYALGRGIEYYDAPAVREIVRETRPDHYRLSAIVMRVVKSAPFQKRMSR